MVVVLASGGMDSAVLLAMAQQKQILSAIVFCWYAQPAALQEWKALQQQIKLLKIEAPVHEVPLTTLSAKKMQVDSGLPGPRVVFARNLVMLGHSANYAESIGANRVWYGATADDFKEYHDCRPIFLDAINVCLQDVKVEAPLSEYHKPKIRALLKQYQIPIGDTWSCYAPIKNNPCEAWDSCKLRYSNEMTLHNDETWRL